MGTRGPKPKPRLVAVREGNPNKERLREDIQLPPAELTEPAWASLLPLDPDNRTESQRARGVASESWRRVHSRLHGAGLLADVDADALADLAILRAMIWVETRRWSRGEQDRTRSPSLSQLRTQFVQLATRFYLTPGDRANVDVGSKGDGADADFDRPADPAGRDLRA